MQVWYQVILLSSHNIQSAFLECQWYARQREHRVTQYDLHFFLQEVWVVSSKN